MFPVSWCMSGLFLPWAWERSKQLQTRTVVTALWSFIQISLICWCFNISKVFQEILHCFFFSLAWQYQIYGCFCLHIIRNKAKSGMSGGGLLLAWGYPVSFKWLLLRGWSVLFPPSFMRQSVGSFHFYIMEQISIKKQEKVEVKRKQKRKRGGKKIRKKAAR